MHQTSTRFTPNPGMSLSPMRNSGSAPLSAAALPSFDADGLDTQVSLNRLEQIIGFLDKSLRLPDNPRTFSIYLAALMVIFAGAFMHVLVAAQITQARYKLGELDQEYMVIEQENGDLIFKIADASNLARLYTQATAQGYGLPESREFVFLEPEVAALPAAEIAAVEPAPAPVEVPVDQAPLQSWRDFWLRTWMPDAVQPAPSAATQTAVAVDVGSAITTWWDQTTTRAGDLFEKLLGR